ncbi:hypothetical protein EDD15DRAFT_2249209 [Pisolithus albus]|nr:hypothetical protein EDD15DRAFT_2249209 [Pisolithus albus]
MSVGFSSDGKRIISGSDDKTIRIWDAHGYEAVQSKWVAYNSGGVALMSYIINCQCYPLLYGLICTQSFWIYQAYSVCFSSKSLQALYNSPQLLDGLMEEDMIVRHQPVKVFHDHWIRGPKGRLLLWIPPTFWGPFYSMWTIVVIPKGRCVELDLSQMVHGEQWHQCFKSVV